MSQETEPLGVGPLFMASSIAFLAVVLVLLPVDGMSHMLYALGSVLGAFAASFAVWGGLSRDRVAVWAAVVCGVLAGLLLAGYAALV